MVRAHRVVVAALCAAALQLIACGGGGYCQSGPTHGTQCYSSTEVTGGAPPGPPAGAITRPSEVPKASATKYHFEPADAGVSPTR